MKKCYFTLWIFIALVPVHSQWKMKSGKWETLRLTRTYPAPAYDSAPGIANGRLAAKIMCNVKNEKIFLNDNTFWPGYPRELNDPSVLNTLKDVRTLLLNGKNHEADQKARQLQGKHCFPYIALGNLFLDFDGDEKTSSYKHVLNLDSAMVQVKYTKNDVHFTREIFISYPDQVLVIRLYANKSAKLNFGVRFNSVDTEERKLTHKVTTEGNNTLVMRGFADYAFGGFTGDTSQMKFDARVKVSTDQGDCSSSGSSLKITNADTVLLILSIATSYNGPFKHPSPYKGGLDPTPIAKDYLNKAAVKSYQELLTTHLHDYQNIFRRLWIDINGENPGQRALDFQYIRFEVIQCSRGTNGQPMTLKGIWNDKNKPEWYGHYTLNSEGPKPYWTAETGNMAECIEPVTNFVKELAVNGAKTAKTNYGCRGWVAHHNSDLWKHSTMVGDKGHHPYWVCWMFGGVIMAELLAEHYKFSGDVKYLREHAYPVLKGAAEFCLDWLIDDGSGKLTTAPSTSPENSYMLNGKNIGVCMGSTCDISNVKQVFLDVIEFSKTLDVDTDFRNTLDSIYKRIVPFKIGNKNQLQEWSQDYVENEPGHRHASHLFSVFPYSLITSRGTPDLFKAAKRSLELRGGGAWLPTKDGWWARLLNGDKALNGLASPAGPTRYTDEYGGYPELLLQSHAGELELLPALPSSWKQGKVLGLRGRIGYEVDIEWENKKLTRTTIRSSLGTTPIVRIQGALVPNLKDDPRITLEYLTNPVGKPEIGKSVFSKKDIIIINHGKVTIPCQGNFSASVINMRGQVVKSMNGNGPVAFRLPLQNWTPGLYILLISAANGSVCKVIKIDNFKKF